MYLLYEIYDPAHEKAAEGAPKEAKSAINLLSSLELIQGSTKVYETPIVQAKSINVEGRDAVSIELDVPLSGLKPGPYICQLNVIDDAAGSFAFPRFAVLVREPPVTPRRLPTVAPAAPITVKRRLRIKFPLARPPTVSLQKRRAAVTRAVRPFNQPQDDHQDDRAAHRDQRAVNESAVRIQS